MKFNQYLFLPSITAIAAVVVVGCNSTPLSTDQQSYVGTWVSEDGNLVKIDADGSGETKNNSKTISGGETKIDQQQLTISFGPIKQTFQITEPPSQQNGRWTMALDNVVYVKNDANTVDSATVTKTVTNQPEEDLPTSTNTDDTFSATIEQFIQTSFAQQTEVEVSSVTCPENIPIQSGYRFSCEIKTAQAQTVQANVTQENDQGSIVWNAENLVVLKSLETDIEQSIKSQIDADTNVDCGGKIKLTQPGEEFNCGITATDGSTAVVVVKVKDNQGSVDWKISN